MDTQKSPKMQNITQLNYAQKRWRFCAIIWPLLCISFAGIILCESSRNIDERIGDTAFTIIPLIFFGIGMSIRHRLLREQKFATTYTNAIVVSDGLRTHPGKRNFFPEFEFQANDITYRVHYSAGYSFRIVSKGKSVGLYYNSDNPNQFYVPVMRKHDHRLSLILCGIGIVGPIMGLAAPLMRTPFLY